MNPFLRYLALGVLVTCVVAVAPAKQKKDDPLATLNFVVIRDENGKPVRNAAVVMHPVAEDGRQVPNGLELKTSPEGKASYDGVPYGKLRVQVLAPGFQTYGEDYEIHEPSMDITIKLKRPARQYSIYEEHPKPDNTPGPQQNPPPK
jgi:hypothetical protein